METNNSAQQNNKQTASHVVRTHECIDAHKEGRGTTAAMSTKYQVRSNARRGSPGPVVAVLKGDAGTKGGTGGSVVESVALPSLNLLLPQSTWRSDNIFCIVLVNRATYKRSHQLARVQHAAVHVRALHTVAWTFDLSLERTSCRTIQLRPTAHSVM